MPLEDDSYTISASWNFEANYYLPGNYTELITPFVLAGLARSDGHINRRSAYQIVERRFERFVFRHWKLNVHIKFLNWVQCCYIQGVHKRMVRFQKLTRNLFLTLHGHNVHRQQRQLSKFLMRYQQFASHAYCGAAGPVSKMVSQQGKAFCVLRFEVFRSVITVQREFRARFRKDAPYVVPV